MCVIMRLWRRVVDNLIRLVNSSVCCYIAALSCTACNRAIFNYKKKLTTLCVSSTVLWTPLPIGILMPRWLSCINWCVPWYQIMYMGGSRAPLITHRSTTVLPAFTYRSASPTSSVLGTALRRRKTIKYVCHSHREIHFKESHIQPPNAHVMCVL